MARAGLLEWLTAITSDHGPANERDRHIAHCIAFHMLFNGDDGAHGCYPSQHRLAAMVGVKSHKTAAKSLERLCSQGWLAVMERRTQFGRTGRIYFPAIPDDVASRIGDVKKSPMQKELGTPSNPQSQIIGDAANRIGDSASNIGDSERRIGDAKKSPELELLNKSGTAPLSLAMASSAAPQKRDPESILAARARTQFSGGKGNAAIASKLQVTIERVEQLRKEWIQSTQSEVAAIASAGAP